MSGIEFMLMLHALYLSRSAPIYDSPQRHHRRNPIVRRPVKVGYLFGDFLAGSR